MARLASMLTSNYQLKLITLLVNTHSATNFLRLSPTNRVQKACQLPVVNRETRSTISTAVKKSSTGVLEAKCHFCEKKTQETQGEERAFIQMPDKGPRNGDSKRHFRFERCLYAGQNS